MYIYIHMYIYILLLLLVLLSTYIYYISELKRLRLKTYSSRHTVVCSLILKM